MKTVNLAILGSGFMGKVYLNAAESLKHYYPDLPKVKVLSLLVSKRKTQKDISEIKKRYEIDNVTSNYQDILNNKDIDAIYIATPNDFHCEQVCSAIIKGKHVLCEKPMSLNLEESKKMLDLSKKYPNVIANMVFEYRYIPAITQIKNIIDSNQIGDIIQFRAFYLHGSYINKRPLTWRLKKGTGGAFVDLGPHLLDLMAYLIGDIKISNLKTVTKMPNREVDDVAWILCKAKDADGTIEVSRVSNGSVDELRFEIHGTKGAIKWNLEELNYYYLYLSEFKNSGYNKVPYFTDENDNSDFPPPKVTSGWLNAHTHSLYHFVKEISDKDYNNNAIAKFMDGFKVQKLLDKLK